VTVDPRKTLPTKINLIRLRREQKTIKRIRKVLEEKRNALILYIRSMIDEYERLYSEVSGELSKAYKFFEKALLLMGYEEARRTALSYTPSLRIRVKEKVLFAVRVPSLKVDEKTIPEIDTPVNAPLEFIRFMQETRRVFVGFIKLVELEYALRKLIEELRGTQRLINAIDNVILPSYERTIKHIKLVLDERMREEFLRLKMLKRRREKIGTQT